MAKPSLGKFDGGGAAVIDLPRLLETRMLIQANSGGGKSWAIRRLLETRNRNEWQDWILTRSSRDRNQTLD